MLFENAIQKVEKKCEGKFITRYDITYETVDHQKKIYEMISRNGDITDFEGLHGKMADAVVIIATDETGEKILIDKEFVLLRENGYITSRQV